MADGEPAATEPATAAATAGSPERAADRAAAAEVANAAYDFRFELVWLETYHADRAAWLRGVHKGCLLVVAVAGTGVVASALGQAPAIAVALGVLTTFIGATETIFDLAGRAGRHERQIETLQGLRSELEARPDDMPTIRGLRAKRTALAHVEAGAFWAVNALAWNAAYRSLAPKAEARHCLTVGRLARPMRHLMRFGPASFTTPAERADAHAALSDGRTPG